MSNVPFKRYAFLAVVTAVALYVAFWLLRFVTSTVFDLAVGALVIAALVAAARARDRVRQDGWRAVIRLPGA